jgi:hypothetical protein
MQIETEKYEVEIQRDPTSGRVVCEIWEHPDDRQPITTGGWTRLPPPRERAHRIGGPAVTRWDPTTGVAVREAWYIRGRRHREDGPALVKRDPQTGRVVSSFWYIDGKLIPKAQRPKPVMRTQPEQTPGGTR